MRKKWLVNLMVLALLAGGFFVADRLWSKRALKTEFTRLAVSGETIVPVTRLAPRDWQTFCVLPPYRDAPEAFLADKDLKPILEAMKAQGDDWMREDRAWGYAFRAGERVDYAILERHPDFAGTAQCWTRQAVEAEGLRFSLECNDRRWRLHRAAHSPGC